MKTKYLFAIVPVLCIGLFAGCSRSEGKSTENSAASGLPVVAVCMPELSSPFMNGIADAIKNKFTGIANVQVSSSDGDNNRMITLVQNYAAMNVSTLYIMPGDPKAVIEAMREARKSGVKIAVAGVSIGEDGADAYDCMVNVNQYLVGAYAALLGKQWLDETYPNASAGSIETVVLINTTTEDALARTNGLLSIAEPYLKNAQGQYVDAKGTVTDDSGKTANPAYSPGVKIVGTTQTATFQEGLVAMENFLTSNPNIKLVLAYSSDIASGAAQIYADRGLTPQQLAGIGVIGSDFSGNELPLIKEASQGKGVYRATISFGSADLAGDMANMVMGIFDGTLKEKILWDPISLVSAKNGEEFRVLVQNTGAVAPPAN
jgi:ABC-type sugar transport system substrate-binding protein